MATHGTHSKVGDDVVVVVGDREVMGKVSRVTPRGLEVTFQIRLPAGALGQGLGHLTWRNGRESLFALEEAEVVGQVSVLVDPASNPPDQRSYVRLDRRLAVDVTVEGQDVATGSTRDLSTEGAKLKLNRGLKKGETVDIRLHLDDGPIETAAEVLRHRSAADGSHEVAVRFSLPHGEGRTRLVRYVFGRLRR